MEYETHENGGKLEFSSGKLLNLTQGEVKDFELWVSDRIQAALDEAKYEGWENRETWCLNLWLTNEKELYDTTFEVCRDGDIQEAADKLKEFIEELRDGKGRPDIFRDVGSLWRVNWRDIAEGFRNK